MSKYLNTWSHMKQQIICKQCQSRAVRLIGNDQYFCVDCCTVFKINQNKITSFSLSPDGGLVKLASCKV